MQPLLGFMLLVLTLCPPCAEAQAASQPEPAGDCGYEILGSIPVNPPAFVQGLALHSGSLYLSSGLYGVSHIRRIDPATGRELARVALPAGVFAEGLGVHDGVVYVLTWREGRVFRFTTPTLRPLAELRLEGEGWGLTGNGRTLLHSDGSARIMERRAADLGLLRSVEVRDTGRPVRQLNELEWVRGRVLANVWGEARVAIIDPLSGQVLGWLDLGPLVARHAPDNLEAVANGIAWDPASSTLYVTGKLWPAIIVIRPRQCPALGIP